MRVVRVGVLVLVWVLLPVLVLVFMPQLLCIMCVVMHVNGGMYCMYCVCCMAAQLCER